jgi:hypothetical protein
MTDMIRWTPTLFEAQAGAFSSTKRYIRKAASGGYAMAAGNTVTGVFVDLPGTVNDGVSRRFKIGSIDWSYDHQATASATPTPVVESVEI